MRPLHRLFAGIALAASLVAGANPLHAQKPSKTTTHQKLQPLRTDFTSDEEKKIEKALDDVIGDRGRDTYNTPDDAASFPDRMPFIQGLQREAARLGMNHTPLVIIVSDGFDKNGKPNPINDYAVELMAPGNLPLIIFRHDIFGDQDALLTQEEALAFSVHELEHIRRTLKRGYAIEPPDKDNLLTILVSADPVTLKKQIDYARYNRVEETSCDDAAIRSGHGAALLSGLYKIEALDRIVFSQAMAVRPQNERLTYEEILAETALISDHPLDPTRNAVIWSHLSRGTQKAHPELNPKYH